MVVTRRSVIRPAAAADDGLRSETRSVVRQRLRIARTLLRADGGFAIVEVMVSAVLLVVLATASYSVIDQSAGRSASNRARAVAVSLAEQDQDRMRAMPFTQLGDENRTTTRNVRGLTYTVVSKAQYASDAAGIVPCAAGSGAVQYLQIGSTVTWPNMSGVDPVRIESLVTPNVGNVDGGAIVVVITKANGGPQPDVPVTVAGVVKNTDSGGCARWTNLPAGTHTVSFGKSGYVTPGFAPTVSENVSVLSKETSNKSYAYDQEASVTATVRRIADETATTWRSVRFASGTALQTRPTSPSGTMFSSITASGLYPFTNGYKVYAGRCDGNDPAAYQSDFFTANPAAAVIPTPGGTGSATAYMRRITLTISKTNSTTLGTRSPRIQVAPLTSNTLMSDCSESIARYSGNAAVSSTSSNNHIDLPFGLWRVCVDDNRSSSSRRLFIDVNNTPAGSVSYPPYGPTASISLNSAATGQCPS